MTEKTLERRAAMATLLADRPNNLFVVPGLGSTTWDAAAAAGGNDDRDFYLWGAMGGAAMIGLGLALAQPKARVAVITGDGEMLMGLGSLATIGVKQPANLFVVVFDNGLYGETGMQASHTQNGVDLCSVARACGFERVLDVYDQDGLTALASMLRKSNRMLFARVRISREDAPRFLPGEGRRGHQGSRAKGRGGAGLAMLVVVVMMPPMSVFMRMSVMMQMLLSARQSRVLAEHQ